MQCSKPHKIKQITHINIQIIFSIPFSYFLNVFTAIYINIPQNTDKINILNSLSFNLIIEISFATLLRLLNLVKLIKFPTKNAPIKLPIKVNSNSKILFASTSLLTIAVLVFRKKRFN